jgi:shikimate kinase
MDTVGGRPIALVGLMGAGKSAVAEALGTRMGGEVCDLDLLVEAAAEAEVAEIFEREGEAGFRQRESEALERALDRELSVLATGGGIVVQERNRALLRDRCRVAWLVVTPAESARRLRAAVHLRPLLAGAAIEERLDMLLRERSPLYEMVAEWKVPTDGRTAAEVAEAVFTLANGAPSRGA